MVGWWRSPWLHFCLWIVLIFGLSSIPDLKPPMQGLPGVDKLYHAGEYAVLGVLWGRWRGGGLLRGALLGLVVGGIDEISQARVVGREPSLLDAGADVFGAALGCFAWSLWTRWRRSSILS